MKCFKVPFHQQPNKDDCGPTSLRMVLEFFNEDHSEEDIRGLCGNAWRDGVWAIGVAYASAKLGFKTDFYIDPDKNSIDSNELEQYQSFESVAKNGGVKVTKEFIALDKILEKISEGCIPIVSLNLDTRSNQSTDKNEHPLYKPSGIHMVPIIGCETNLVYYHDPKLPQGKQKRNRDKFEEARKDTDGGTIFVYKK